MPERHRHRPVFDDDFDIVVVGGGHAGFAAALALASEGHDALLIDRHGDLLAESGRAFAINAGTDDGALWQELEARVTALGGTADGWLDGALAECVGTAMLAESTVTSLYYASIVGVDLDRDGLVSAGLLATRVGLRRVTARRWVDATPTGELARLSAEQVEPRPPSRSRRWLHLQHPDWTTLPPAGGHPTSWPSQRAFELPAAGPHLTDALLEGLARVGTAIGPAELAKTCLSHFSFASFDEFASQAVPVASLPANVAVATASLGGRPVATLADLH
ncbi:MAG: FAD-dependent oxidoreductase, partial [Propionicimonas sp.]